MKVYILEISESEFAEMPFDRTHIMLVKAPNEKVARELAAHIDVGIDYSDVWTNSNRSSCMCVSELPPKEGVLKSWGWKSA
jgi:hypothetical protein